MVTWVEIPTVDFNRGVAFYNALFQLNMQALDFGTEKMACFPNNEGAVIYEPNYKPSDSGVVVNFTIPTTIEDALIIVENNGGKVLKPKTKIEVEGRGYFAIVLDCEGNKIGLYQD